MSSAVTTGYVRILAFMARKQVGAIDKVLLDRVDAARGDVPRAKFVERALEAALGSYEGSRVAPGAGFDSPTPAPPRASAEKVLGVERPPAPNLSALFERTELRFGCPVQGCGFRAGSERARCPDHGRAVVE